MTDCPKIELHVHLEGTVQPRTLLAVARRNGIELPVDSESDVHSLYDFRNFKDFVKVWMMTTSVLQTEEDFRRVVVEYAGQAAAHGCVYLEGIFSVTERVRNGVAWDALFTGYCDGAQQAKERYGVDVRLTPDMLRGASLDEALQTVRHCVRYRDRGIVGLGLAGLETRAPARDYAIVFEMARDKGLAALPHAGETTGAASVRDALEALHPPRIRHGIRAIEDRGLVQELADRGVVLDVCLTSNVRTGAVSSMDDHPLAALVAAGVPCSISTDDPAMFDTDLTREYELVERMGLSLRDVYDAGLAGALCDEATRDRLTALGRAHRWT